MSKSQLVPYIALVIISVPFVGMATIELSEIMGLRPLPVPVVGTGSMYPSLFWSSVEGGPEDESQKVIEEYRSTPHLYKKFDGLNLVKYSFFKSKVGYGDMVAFKSDKTREILSSEGKDPGSGFIKRVIGIPGDQIELRDGFVYKNGHLLDEPYISTPRSTYGGSTLKDCQIITLGANKYFVLGDNRKVSSDSRFELGLVDISDIEYFLPYAQQTIYHSLYRETGGDSKLLGQPSLIPAEFVELVNKKRQSPLTLKSPLRKSSSQRGTKLLEDQSTSYGLKSAVANTGYSNIVLGEFVSYGHFSSQELLENLLYNPSTAKQILSPDYQDIGISAVNKEVDGCPTQVIVGHLGGYLPPSYSQDTINSWQKLRDNLGNTIPSWEKAVGHAQIDQTKLTELLTILRRRLNLAQEIVGAMDSKKWLSSEQEKRIESDEGDAKLAESLAKELNKE